MKSEFDRAVFIIRKFSWSFSSYGLRLAPVFRSIPIHNHPVAVPVASGSKTIAAIGVLVPLIPICAIRHGSDPMQGDAEIGITRYRRY